MIYTSYFSRLRSIDTNKFVPVSIARINPAWYEGKSLKILAPSDELLKYYKQHLNEGDIPEKELQNIYIEYYYKTVLNNLEPEFVNGSLIKLGCGNDVVMLCYETPDKFCHRFIVSQWLNNAGIECKEFIAD